jgi:hypothetical protein
VLGRLASEPELDQLLARALVYRLVTEIVRREGAAGVDAAGRAGQPVTDLVLARLAWCRSGPCRGRRYISLGGVSCSAARRSSYG